MDVNFTILEIQTYLAIQPMSYSNCKNKTRMHSSRMRTVHCRGRLPRLGVCPGGCLPRGCLPKGVCLGEGVCLGSAWGCLSRGCLPGGCLPRGLYTLPGPKADTPLNRITDRCKNITFPQLLLWEVIKTKRN